MTSFVRSSINKSRLSNSAVDSRGQTIDFLLSANRDAARAKRFFRKALGQPHTVSPRTITVDKNSAYPRAVAEMKDGGELWRRSRLRQVKHLNNIVEQEHRRIKRLVRPGLGFGSFWTARRKAAERTVDGLWAAIGRVIDTVTPDQCANFFAAAGYDPD